jgi:geranylgeranyl pyrophosphate synthase
MSSPVEESFLVDWLAETRIWADAHMEKALSSLDLGPTAHSEAVRYALMGPGKRLRPALVRLICAQMGGQDADAAPSAVAIEMLHTYSLVHDDLPCMDDDDLRRNRPTVHKVYGEAEAVLVGDGLQSLAFEWLARTAHSAEQVAILAHAAGPAGMVGGQSLDLAATGRGDAIAVDEVRRIHSSKTAALIAAAVELGAVAGGATAEQRMGLARYGRGLGLCFQAVDDLLDVTGDAGTLGKTPGKDEAAQKATLVATLGLDGAREEARSLAQETRETALEVGCPEGGLALALVDYLLDRTR